MVMVEKRGVQKAASDKAPLHFATTRTRTAHSILTSSAPLTVEAHQFGVIRVGLRTGLGGYTHPGMLLQLLATQSFQAALRLESTILFCLPNLASPLFTIYHTNVQIRSSVHILE